MMHLFIDWLIGIAFFVAVIYGISLAKSNERGHRK